MLTKKATWTRQLGDQYCQAHCVCIVCLSCNSSTTDLFGIWKSMSFSNWQFRQGFEPSVRKQNLSASNNLYQKTTRALVKLPLCGSSSLLKGATDSLTCSDCTVHSVSDRRSA